VSPEAARREYGLVLVAREAEVETEYVVDEAATAKLRGEMRASRKGPLPLIDRGPGYEKMLRGECAPRV
jgi:N-methylhydantoinase B